MNKKFGISALAALTLLMVSSCGGSKGGSSSSKEEFNVSFIGMDYEVLSTKRVKEGAKPGNIEAPHVDGYDFKGWVDRNGDSVDLSGEKIDTNKVYYASYSPIEYNISFGSSYDSIKYTTAANMALPYPSQEGKIFSGWTDGNNHNLYAIKAGTTGNLNLTPEFHDAKNIMAAYKILAQDQETGAISNKTKGIFKVSSGEVRPRIATWTNPLNPEETKKFSKSFKNPTISVSPTKSGTIEFYVQNGSSSATTQNVKVTSSKGDTKTYNFSGAKTAVAPYGSGSPIVKIGFEAEASTTYTITYVSGTIDIFDVEFITEAKEEALTGIKLKDIPDANVLEGSKYDGKDVKVVASYGGENGYELDVSTDDISIDDSNVDYSNPGTYKAKAVYCGQDAEFDVNVYEATDFDINMYKTVVENNGYNEIYVTEHLSNFMYGDENLYNTKGMTITVHSELGSKKKDFIISKGFEVSYGSIKRVYNKVEVYYPVNGKMLKENITVEHVDVAPYKNADGVYEATVDSKYTGAIGALDGAKGNVFKTINDALDFYRYNGINDAKIINVKAGLYKEKLEIDLPNLTIKGDGICKATYGTDANYNDAAYNSASIIEWDSIYGIPDASGFSQNTDSTATVAIRKSAENCVFENITLSNMWNCEEVFAAKVDLLAKYGIASGGKVNDHRALALICQADKFQMKGCSLLGYQDTVEFMTGRQYVKDTYIAGNTDFIFGTNATTYFTGCEIHFIYKDSTSIPCGYITAYKGANDEADTAIDYGFIFDNCNFTADSKVAAKSIALGRPWGKYSQVTIMNSTLCDKIAVSDDARYYSMSGVNPSDETVRYYEYNNTGDGAIKASLTGVSVLTADKAKNYNDLTVIYGTKNGAITYQDAWTPTI